MLQISDDLTHLWRAWVDGHNRAAREELINIHYPMVERIAAKRSRNLPAHVEAEEIKQYGSLGLIRAVDGFDPYAGTPFGPYAIACINSVILDSLRKLDWAPRSLRRRFRDIEIARQKLTHGLGRTPTDDEVALMIGDGSTGSQVRQVLLQVSYSHHASLDEHRDEGDEAAVEPAVQEHPVSRVWELGARFIASLSPQEQLVLRFFYIDRRKQADIASLLGVTEAKVSQLHSGAVLELREAITNSHEVWG